MNEYLCDSDINPKDKDVDSAMYERESHMLIVLNTILNKSNEKFGIANGKGRAYEAIITMTSIKMAQKYYDLLKCVVAGKTPVKVNEGIKKVLPDFPKFAITYSVTENEPPVNTNYEPLAFARVNINYEYIIGMIQDIVTPSDDETDEEFKEKVDEIRGYITEFSEGNPKLGGMMLSLLDGVEKDRMAYADRNISEILARMKKDTLNTLVDNFAKKWFMDRAAVMYAVENNNNGLIPNASILKDSIRYAEYKDSTDEPLKKPKARSQMISELEDLIEEEIVPLQIGVNY